LLLALHYGLIQQPEKSLAGKSSPLFLPATVIGPTSDEISSLRSALLNAENAVENCV
jgi:hypothetical protein